MYWGARVEPDVSGDCDATVQNTVDDATWGTQLTRCAARNSFPSAGCDDTSRCVPKAPTGFDPGHCVYKSGDVACAQASEYDTKRVSYGGFSDGRGCETCSCGDPQGSCEGTARFSNGTCGNGSVAGTIDESGCEIVTVNPGANTVRFEADIDANCSEFGGGKNDGTVVLQSAITVCCL